MEEEGGRGKREETKFKCKQLLDSKYEIENYGFL